MTLVQIAWVLAASLCAATLAVLVRHGWPRRRAAPALFADAGQAAILLFDGETLLDASTAGKALLASSRVQGSAWQRFLSFAQPRFAGLIPALESLPETGRFSLTQAGIDGLTLIAEWRSGLCRLTLLEPHMDAQGRMTDSLAQRAQDDELALLRQITDETPFPVWRESPDGIVLWANPTCLALAVRRNPDQALAQWPLPRLLDVQADGRLALDMPGSDMPLWFDCTLRSDDRGRTVIAQPADGLVQSERALASFVQTLTKTFAQLPIGLAIFDRQRRLQLFNPALTDLSGLSVEFLSARPGLFAFLDAMRERGMIPEPRDYKAWRKDMAALERSASEGSYEETWALPAGLTYRVVGRPHPDGALALLFHDISDEMTRTRRMRADVELGQAVIDASDEAIAVFSASGQTLMANAAYARLWGVDPMDALSGRSITELAEAWRTGCAPSHFWALAEGYAVTSGPREAWVSHARLNDGRSLRCRLAPLSGGATLIGFVCEPGPDLASPVPVAAQPAPAEAAPRRQGARRSKA